MLQTPFPFKRLSGAANDRDSLRVIVFAIADYLFALPAGAVLKVINCPPISSTVESGIGMADLGAQTITILDLRQKIFPQPLEGQVHQDCSLVPTFQRFLLVTQTRTGEICGIPVDKPPTLIDIPLETVRPVPWSYRQVALSFASHMAVLPGGKPEETIKVFLLGMSQILVDKLGLHGQNSTDSPLDSDPVPGEQQQRFLRVRLGDQGSGLLPLHSVVEVVHISTQEISPTPALPSWALGTYSWQGQMLRLVDLEHLVGYSPLLGRQRRKEIPVAVVLELQNQIVGFLVADIYNVENVELQDLQKLQSAESELAPKKLLTFVQGVLSGDYYILDLKAIAQALQWQNH